jgi:hypothetical protein
MLARIRAHPPCAARPRLALRRADHAGDRQGALAGRRAGEMILAEAEEDLIAEAMA